MYPSSKDVQELKREQILRKWPTNDWPAMRLIPWERVNSCTINDTLLCLRTGAQSNCILRGFVQQLIETDAETTAKHQAESLVEELGAEGAGMVKEDLQSTNLAPWGLKVTKLSTKEHAWAGPMPCTYF